VVGTDPFRTHGDLLADIRRPWFGTSATLLISDFQAAANALALPPSAPRLPATGTAPP